MQLTTFFSYKGGAGRSTTCLNTIPFMVNEYGASKSNPILLLDTDIESAGMTYLLDLADAFPEFDVKTMFLGDVPWTYSSVGNSFCEHPLYRYFIPVGNKFGLDDNAAVMFLGVNDQTYVDRANIVGRADTSIDNFRKLCNNNRIPAAVMDSASGDQLTAKMSAENADNLVVCMRPTSQFRMGTFNYLKRFEIRLGSLADDIRVILLPTVVPKNRDIDGEDQLAGACADVNRFVGETKRLDICTDFTSADHFGINEVARFKWKETVLNKLKKENNAALAEDEIQALGRYADLAATIADD